MMFCSRLGLLGAALAISGLGLSVTGQDWPQWGGANPGRNMYATAKGLPTRVDPGKPKPGSDGFDSTTAVNLRWTAKLGSQSYGNVTVAGGKVFIGTNNESPRHNRYAGDRSLLLCFEEATGNYLWQLTTPKLATGKANDWEALGILSAAAIDDNRVYLVSSRCEVLCLTMDGLGRENVGPFKDEAQYMAGPGKPKVEPGPADADIVWQYSMFDELGSLPHNAANCSVLVLGDLVYACTSNGQDWTHANTPAPYVPSLIALNKKTGALAGEDRELIGERLFHGQWSSPSAGKVGDRQLVFFGGGDGVLYAFDALPVEENGHRYFRKVWWVDCNPPEYKMKDGQPIKYPAAEGPSEINATPVFYNNRVYASIGQDPENGDGVGRLICVDATKTGDQAQGGIVWDYRAIHRCLSTVSIDPDTGLLFVADFAGFVHCLDAATGKVYWVHDLKAHAWGSTMVADGKVYVGDEDGDLCILAASKEKKVLCEVNFGAPLYSTPVVANGVLYISSQTHLFAFAEGATPKTGAAK